MAGVFPMIVVTRLFTLRTSSSRGVPRFHSSAGPSTVPRLTMVIWLMWLLMCTEYMSVIKYFRTKKFARGSSFSVYASRSTCMSSCGMSHTFIKTSYASHVIKQSGSSRTKSMMNPAMVCTSAIPDKSMHPSAVIWPFSENITDFCPGSRKRPGTSSPRKSSSSHACLKKGGTSRPGNCAISTVNVTPKRALCLDFLPSTTVFVRCSFVSALWRDATDGWGGGEGAIFLALVTAVNVGRPGVAGAFFGDSAVVDGVVSDKLGMRGDEIANPTAGEPELTACACPGADIINSSLSFFFLFFLSSLSFFLFFLMSSALLLTCAAVGDIGSRNGLITHGMTDGPPFDWMVYTDVLLCRRMLSRTAVESLSKLSSVTSDSCLATVRTRGVAGAMASSS
mmetsp:Transcript_16472/g.42171  ORF Transcript_16472/g.42171 Transcript_16472/m.42171 type:complete len:394 (+) Transcript_16472:1238-2419(+)